MKGLTTLIKLSKRTLDELRRKMGALENQKAQFEMVIHALQSELKREIELAGNNAMMQGFFGDFAKRIKKRQDEMVAEIIKVEKQMEAVRVEISAAFSELKKYEIALENAKLRLAEKRARIETNELDEIAGMQHTRKMKEDND